MLNEVHRLITNHSFKFILTGSSARSLKKLGSNLLAGRALTYRMYPLTCEELGEKFSLLKSLEFGHLPAIYSDYKGLEQEYLDAYIKTYIKEEVQQEGLTRNMMAFSRFLESASFSQGSVLNFAEIAREAAVERKVVESYFHILEDLLIAYRIPVFNKRAKRKLAAHPKFYFFDLGVFKTLRPMGPLDTPEEANGPALETLVLQEFMAINHYHALGYEIYYWRTANKLEVDLVLYGKKKIIAIEITHSSRFKKDKTKGLKAFLKDYPQAEAYLFYTGSQRYFEDEIQVVPVQDALRSVKDFL
ncbi:MAG: ATP-binding protein [Candidatus Caenarcaniphilales bacterium]|nr:ATP-binding protein [Candidatus Caenarcaniphilales bacterium]